MSLKPLNSVGGFSVGEVPSTVVDPLRNITGNTGNFSANVTVLGLLTDNYYYANGVPLDMQQPAGSNTQIQYNLNNDFGASANFTFNSTTNLLTVVGNANVTNTLLASNINSGASALTINANGNVTTFNANGLVTFPDAVTATGNITAPWFVGNFSGNISGNLTVPGANTQILFNNDGNAGASANFTFNSATNLLTVNGNANVSNLNASSAIVATGNVTGGNLTTGGVLSVTGNANVGNIGGGIGVFTGNVTGGNLNTGGVLSVTGNANVGNLGTIGLITATGNVTGGNLNTGGVLSVTGNANVGNLGTTGLITATGNITGGNLNTAGEVVATGNVTGNYFIGNGSQLTGLTTDRISNGNSNVSILTANGNVTISAVGNANIVVVTGTGVNVAGTLNATGNANVGNLGTAGLITATGNITGGNFNTAGLLSATGNVTGGNLNTGGVLSVTGNANVGNLGTIGLITATGNVTGGNLNTGGVLSVTGNANVGNIGAGIGVFTGNITALNANLGNLAVANFFQGDGYLISNITGGNVTGTVANATHAVTANTVVDAAQPNITSVGTLSSVTVTGNANVGNLNATSNVVAGNVIVNTALQTSLIQNGNSNVSINPNGNIAFSVTGTSNVLVLSNTEATVTGNLSVTGNISGNITGNITASGSNTQVQFNDGSLLGASANFTFNKVTNLLTVVGNANVSNLNASAQVVATGNITGGNITTGGQVVATANITGGNITTGGQVVATANVSGGNITTSGNVVANANVVTNNILNRTGNLTITTSGSNGIFLVSGSGVINAGNSRIANLATPTQSNDAVTKEYVDNAVSFGLDIHTPVRVETPSALNATYTQGGTTPTITTISGGNTFTTSATHNLSVGDMIVFDNTFNGVVAGSSYFIYSTPATNQFTLSDTYYGTEITTFTNGTSLGQTSRANSGVGAKLVNAGTLAAINIDGVALSLNDRVLVYAQASAAENGVYYVSVVGSGAVAWELTRTTDADKYIPNSTSGLAAGDYFFVQEGDTGAGESYVLTSPVGEIIIGTTGITFTQFSAASVYKAGTGLTLANLTFSIANTTVSANSYGSGDAVATFTVNPQGQLTAASNTPITANAANLTGTTLASTINSSNLTSVGTLASLSVTGNVTAGNLIGALANGNSNVSIPVANGNVNISAVGNANILIVTGTGVNVFGTLNTGTGNANVGNLGTGGLIIATGNVTGGNLTTSGLVSATGNVTGGNLTTTGQVVAANLVANTAVTVGNTKIGWSTVTTASITANQAIASFAVTGINGVEYLIKGADSAGAKYSVATVQAVTNGSTVDYVIYGTTYLGSTTGTLAVNIVGSNIELQVTPSSTNSTVWTTQFRTV